MTLSEFLLARIAEDEAVARAATGGDRTGNWWIEPDEGGVSDISCLDVQGFVTVVDVDAAHIARHDPARVLAECEAKRKQIDHLIEFMEGDYAPWNEEQLQIMSAVYSDHPDYRDEWRP